MNSVRITDLEPSALDGLNPWLAASPQGTIFTRAAWLELVARASPGRAYALAFEADGRTRAVVPVWETTRSWLGRAAEIPPLTPYWGPCLPPAEGLRPERQRARDHEALAAVAAELGRRYPYARLACHPSLADVRPFLWAGWRAEVRYTAVIAAGDEETYLASLGADTRNDVKKGSSFAVEESADLAPLKPLYDATYARQRLRPPASPAFLAGLGDFIAAGNGAAYYLRDDDGAAAAGHAVVWDARAAYNLLAASDPAARAGGGAFLFFRVARAAASRGLPLDVVGVNVPSIARFKEQFGGVLTPYYLLAWCRTPGVRLAAALGRRRRR